MCDWVSKLICDWVSKLNPRLRFLPKASQPHLMVGFDCVKATEPLRGHSLLFT